MTLPVSVVVPHLRSRASFFERFCLPSIKANEPAQIIVKENDGGDPRIASVLRNAGAREATQPYIIFADDDTVLGADCLAKMMAALEANLSAAYAYSGFCIVTLPLVPSPYPPIIERLAQPFSVESLRIANYIHTTSLIRREAFPGFDESLERFQDWDLWLTLSKLGHPGVPVLETLYFLFFVDQGISLRPIDHLDAIRRKHGILGG